MYVSLNALRASAPLCRTGGETLRAPRQSSRKSRVHLTLEFPLAPVLLRRKPQVELAFFRPLALTHDQQVVGPRQLPHQRCDFLVLPVDLVELAHPEQIRAREPAQPRVRSGELVISGGLLATRKFGGRFLRVRRVLIDPHCTPASPTDPRGKENLCS